VDSSTHATRKWSCTPWKASPHRFYQGIYVIAKVFDEQGCIAYRCKTAYEARCLPGTLEALVL